MLKIGSAAVAVTALVTLAGGALAGGAVAGSTLAMAAPAATALRAAPAWHVTKTVGGGGFQEFSAATAATGTSAWAFESAAGNSKPRAYQLSGHTWAQKPFPSQRGEQVISASSSSPSNVWAFTITDHSTSRVLHFNGHSWKQVKTFGKIVSAGLAVSPADVWVFGEPFAPELGTMHFDGHKWTKVSGAPLLGGSALSARSVWAFGAASVAHWNGRSWHRASVARLLPKKNRLCGPGILNGIDAISAKNVYAAGAAGCPDGEGPLVLLHFNGRAWSRVAIKTVHAFPAAIIGDGSGGLWIPVGSGGPPSSMMYHFAHGTLSKASFPVSPLHLFLSGAAVGTRTTAAIAFGLTRSSITASKSTAVIVQFGS